MKCCCSRYTFGIILGVLNLLACLLYFIGLCMSFGNTEGKRKSEIFLMVVFAGGAIISAVFIYGIVKRQYKLTYGWILFYIGVVVGTGKLIIYTIIDGTKGKITGNELATTLVAHFISFAIEIAILWFSYVHLYEYMKKKAKNSNIPIGYQSNPSEYTPVPAKSTV